MTFSDEQLLKELGVSGSREVLSLTTLERVDSKSSARVVSLTMQGTDGGTTVHLPLVFPERA